MPSKCTASLFLEQGNIHRAIDSFRRAVSLDPQYLVAHGSLSQALAIKAKSDDAARHYQQAIGILNTERKHAGPLALEPALGETMLQKHLRYRLI